MLAARPSGNEASSAKPGPSDPNAVGFVPAFIAGDVFVCKLPHKYVQQSSNHASKQTFQCSGGNIEPTINQSDRTKHHDK